MLQDFVWWWARQMHALLPVGLLREANHGTLVVDVRAGHVEMSYQSRGGDINIGRILWGEPTLSRALSSLPRRPRRVVLRVEPSMLLERQVELPLAAEHDLDRVLRYEMDRLTPFTADEIVWQAVVTRRDHGQRRLMLRLALVPRNALRSLLEVLGKAGLGADWLHARAQDGTLRRFALASEARSRHGRRTVAVLASVAAALAIAAIVMPFVTLALARTSTDDGIAALAPRVAKVEALRKQWAEGAAGADVLTAERARTGDVLQVLAALTEILPDGTWLSELSLHQGRLSFSGQSPTAAQLIPALAGDPGFHNPAFAAPVTRAPDGHDDLFVIRAELGS